MATQFERTTISLTPQQMAGMKKLIENGEYPDLTEGIRAAVNLLLDARTDTGFWEMYMDIRLKMRDQLLQKKEQVTGSSCGPVQVAS